MHTESLAQCCHPEIYTVHLAVTARWQHNLAPQAWVQAVHSAHTLVLLAVTYCANACRCKRVGRPASAGHPAVAGCNRQGLQGGSQAPAIPTEPPATGPLQIRLGRSRWCQLQRDQEPAVSSRCSATRPCTLLRHLRHSPGVQPSGCKLQGAGLVVLPRALAVAAPTFRVSAPITAGACLRRRRQLLRGSSLC